MRNLIFAKCLEHVLFFAKKLTKAAFDIMLFMEGVRLGSYKSLKLDAERGELVVPPSCKTFPINLIKQQ